jgi:hypothetical protein
MTKRTISWYDSDGNIKFVQSAVTEGLEDAPEEGLNFIVGEPSGIVGARVVDGEIVEGTVNYEMPLQAQVRFIRNSDLSKSDWTQAADSPLSEEKKTEWANYRQQLRDMPNNLGDATSIEDVTFPTPPSN